MKRYQAIKLFSTNNIGLISSLKEEIKLLNNKLSKYPRSKESDIEEKVCRDLATQVTPHTYYLKNDPRPVNHPERVADWRKERARAGADAREQEKRNAAARTEVELLQLEIKILKTILGLKKERHGF